jgi:nucleoside-diphosphate-sugar epimerase
MTTLITGASGFVGRRLAQAMLAQGRPVKLVLRRPEVGAVGHQSIIPQPVTSVDGWRSVLSGCDTVIHLIARAHVMKELDPDPSSIFDWVNTQVTVACATAAAIEGVRRFVFVSSIGVHGNETRGHPFRVNDPLDPHSPYAVSKANAESRLRAISEAHSMQWVIIRPPLVYGPNAPGNVYRMMQALHKGVPLPLARVTENRRSFVAIDNLVDLLMTCIDHPEAANKAFLVSDAEDLSTAELLRRLGRVMSRPARLFPFPVGAWWTLARAFGKGAMAQSLLGSLEVDILYTRNALGWSPPLSVEEGLCRAAEGLNP